MVGLEGGFIDRTGDFVIAPKLRWCVCRDGFSKGLAAVQRERPKLAWDAR
jgi:hypothetical protein